MYIKTISLLFLGERAAANQLTEKRIPFAKGEWDQRTPPRWVSVPPFKAVRVTGRC